MFGGFYAREMNYLNLQHDITTFNLESYAESQGQKMLIDNLKTALYSEDEFQRQVSGRGKYNSFIRPKM